MHTVFVIPGVVDLATVKAQADRRGTDKWHPEATAIHMHRHTELCNPECYVHAVPEPTKGVEVSTPEIP